MLYDFKKKRVFFTFSSCSYLLSSSLKKLEEMIEPFRLHEGSKDAAQAEAMRKDHPWKITDEELSTFEEKVKPLTLSEDFIYSKDIILY